MTTNLQLGCGKNKKEGFINIDRAGDVDLILDVGSQRFPFENNSVDYVVAYDFIEHLDTEQTDYLLDELYRICKPDAIIEFTAPYYTSPVSCRVWHKQRISETYFADYEAIDENKCHSLDHKFYFKIDSEVKYRSMIAPAEQNSVVDQSDIVVCFLLQVIK